ncbi:cobalamin B12-binding domain-containing protein, partial [Candidatus Poribacteria bacterium]|nr:cobalamin B12-binding domain-containing protein [Candidatus Poribacteria bacterium]
MTKNRFILGACLGECIHVAGILSFLQIAEKNDYKTNFLGVAVSIEKIIKSIKKLNPGIVAISYRLSPETGEVWLKKLIQAIESRGLKNNRIFVFGGTEPIADIARGMGFFDAVFGGESNENHVISFLQGKKAEIEQNHVERSYASTLLSRIAEKYPLPAIRSHFGLPSFDDTLAGVKKIAESGTVDIISLATDQDAQANFFHPERQDPSRKGAGGVPVRTPEQFRMLYEASRFGNYPLMRVYAGTDDLIKLAEVYFRTINNCFAAIPIFWFNEVDGRGPMNLLRSIEVHIDAIKWHAERHIPVELNEPHHWSLRGAHDTIYVATSFISAYIAKMLGVRDYIMQLMFNTPPGTSFKMDLAKMLAVIELVEELQDENFSVHRETRAGLMSFPADQNSARGQLASSVMLQ